MYGERIYTQTNFYIITTNFMVSEIVRSSTTASGKLKMHSIERFIMPLQQKGFGVCWGKGDCLTVLEPLHLVF